MGVHRDLSVVIGDCRHRSLFRPRNCPFGPRNERSFAARRTAHRGERPVSSGKDWVSQGGFELELAAVGCGSDAVVAEVGEHAGFAAETGDFDYASAVEAVYAFAACLDLTLGLSDFSAKERRRLFRLLSIMRSPSDVFPQVQVPLKFLVTADRGLDEVSVLVYVFGESGDSLGVHFCNCQKDISAGWEILGSLSGFVGFLCMREGI